MKSILVPNRNSYLLKSIHSFNSSLINNRRWAIWFHFLKNDSNWGDPFKNCFQIEFSNDQWNAMILLMHCQVNPILCNRIDLFNVDLVIITGSNWRCKKLIALYEPSSPTDGHWMDPSLWINRQLRCNNQINEPITAVLSLSSKRNGVKKKIPDTAMRSVSNADHFSVPSFIIGHFQQIWFSLNSLGPIESIFRSIILFQVMSILLCRP